MRHVDRERHAWPAGSPRQLVDDRSERRSHSWFADHLRKVTPPVTSLVTA